MTATPSRPNILFIMTDQQRYDQMGYSSNNFFETPNLDRLAGSGVIFENAYSTSTVCVPARTSLLTGLFPHRAPTQINGLALQEGFWTIAHALRGAGYETATIGKGHYYPIHSRHGFERMRMVEHLNCYSPGVVDDYLRWLVWEGKADSRASHLTDGRWGQKIPDYWKNHTAMQFPYEEKYHPTSWTADESIRFLKERDQSKPFFLLTSFTHPHAPFDPPEPYASRYSLVDAPMPDHDITINDGLPPSAKALMYGANSYGYNPVSKVEEEPLRRILTYIRALIYQIDVAIGRILEHVDLSNTIVVFTVDHGDFYARRGLILKTPFFPFDDLAKVPFFCAGPGIAQGKRVANCVETADFVPTCLDIADIKFPRQVLDCQSLIPHFSDGQNANDRVVYTSSQDGIPMARKANLKYFLHRRSGEEILFDLSKDPFETKNLIEDSSYVSAAEELRIWMKDKLNQGIPDLPRCEGPQPMVD